MTEGRWHILLIWVPLMIFFIEDDSGCELRLPISPLLIGGSLENIQREVGSLKRELQNITKNLNKISK